MANGRLWSSDELNEIRQLLEHDGTIIKLAQRIDRTPNSILFKAQQILQQGS